MKYLKFRTKTIAVLLVLGTLFGYWQYVLYEKRNELILISRPFYDACLSLSGCILAPTDWSKDFQPGHFYKGNMQYSATSSEFEIRWHVGTDVHLVAKGGKGNALTIEKEVD